MQTERRALYSTDELGEISPSSLREVSSKPVEGRVGIMEQKEELIERNEEMGTVLRYPIKRVWRDSSGRMIAFADWEYSVNERGVRRGKKLSLYSSVNPHDVWNVVLTRKQMNPQTEQEFHFENENEHPRERLVKRKNGAVVSVHDIAYGSDGSKRIITWTPIQQGEKRFWRQLISEVLPNREERQDRLISLSGPFKQDRGILWPDARGERLGFPERNEEIAWQIVDP